MIPHTLQRMCEIDLFEGFSRASPMEDQFLPCGGCVQATLWTTARLVEKRKKKKLSRVRTFDSPELKDFSC